MTPPERVAPTVAAITAILLISACATTPQSAPDRDTQIINSMRVTGGSAADVAAFLALQKTWINSYLRGDMDTLMTLHNEHTVLMPRNTADLHGLDAIRQFFEGRINKYDIDFRDDPQELEINGDWAFLLGHFSLTGTPFDGGEVFSDQGRYFVLYRKTENGKWIIYRDIDNSLPPPATR